MRDEKLETLQTLLLVDSGTSLDLIIVVVDASDVTFAEACNVSHGSTDTAANVQDTEALFDFELVGEVVLVASDRGLESFALVANGEVEGLSPTPKVEIGRQIEVLVHHARAVLQELLLDLQKDRTISKFRTIVFFFSF